MTTTESRPTVDEAFGLATDEEISRAWDDAHRDEAERNAIAPRVGDRVVFTGDAHLSSTWMARQTEPGLVVAVIGRACTVWHDGGCYYPLPGSVRVVETAMYSPPAPGAPAFFIDEDAHGDPTIWRHDPGEDPIACLRRRAADPDLWAFLTRAIPGRPSC